MYNLIIIVGLVFVFITPPCKALVLIKFILFVIKVFVATSGSRILKDSHTEESEHLHSYKQGFYLLHVNKEK